MSSLLSQLQKKWLSQPYLLRRVTVFGLFSGSFAYASLKAKEAKSEALRLAFAGSIACMVTEMCAFGIDTLNSNMKVHRLSNLRKLI